jgi:hypothetical protein
MVPYTATRKESLSEGIYRKKGEIGWRVEEFSRVSGEALAGCLVRIGAAGASIHTVIRGLPKPHTMMEIGFTPRQPDGSGRDA